MKFVICSEETEHSLKVLIADCISNLSLQRITWVAVCHISQMGNRKEILSHLPKFIQVISSTWIAILLTHAVKNSPSSQIPLKHHLLWEAFPDFPPRIFHFPLWVPKTSCKLFYWSSFHITLFFFAFMFLFLQLTIRFLRRGTMFY